MKKIVNISIWALFLLATLALLSFTLRKKENIICDSIVVNVDVLSGNHFVTPKRVEDILANTGFKKGVDKFSQINSKKLEKKLLSLSSVEEVEVYKSMKGELRIDIRQRKPIARVFNRNGYSLYIDDKGKTMETSEHYTARVLGVNGYLKLKAGEDYYEIVRHDSVKNTTLLDEVYEVALAINKDEFLKALIEQIFVEKNEEIVLIPKVGNQEIIFGKAKNIETKFEKLKLFYTKGINPNNLNLYKTINLKFDNQIVCKKNK